MTRLCKEIKNLMNILMSLTIHRPHFNPVGVPNLFVSPILGAPELTIPSTSALFHVLLGVPFENMIMMLTCALKLELRPIIPRSVTKWRTSQSLYRSLESQVGAFTKKS